MQGSNALFKQPKPQSNAIIFSGAREGEGGAVGGGGRLILTLKKLY